MSEPLLIPNPKRFSLFPIRHGDLWSLYKEAESSFWQAEEITLDKDVEDWPVLPADIRDWITSVLGWFQVADGIVNENFITFGPPVLDGKGILVGGSIRSAHLVGGIESLRSEPR